MKIRVTGFDPDRKIRAIKAYRSLTFQSLLEAKEWVESLPHDITVADRDGNSIVATLREFGLCCEVLGVKATIEIRLSDEVAKKLAATHDSGLWGLTRGDVAREALYRGLQSMEVRS